MYVTAATVTRETLNTLMEFDHVIRVHADGQVTEPEGVYAPEVAEHDGVAYVGNAGPGRNDWILLNGYSGQAGYSGPVMHLSEYIGGTLATDILCNPGYYVAVLVCDGTDSESCHDGWAVAFMPEGDQ